MLECFRLGMERDDKDDGTPVTKADTAINQLVLDSFERDFPDISVIGEEGSHRVDGARFTILCDPVDGTIPFCRGLPISAFCISMIRAGLPVMATIHDPFCNRTWCAERGSGTFLNDERASVSSHDHIERSCVCVCTWPGSPYNLHVVAGKLMGMRAQVMNGLTIAYMGGLVASGAIEATIFPGRKIWETSAMQLIVEEAGGKATDLYGKPLRYDDPSKEIDGHIISNGRIHDTLVELVGHHQQ